MDADICIQTESLARTYERPALRKAFAAFPADTKVVFCRHGDGRLDFGQTASASSGQYRRGRGLLVRELANDQEIMVAEGQVPPDELAAYALEELRNSGSACRSVARARLAARSPRAATSPPRRRAA